MEGLCGTSKARKSNFYFQYFGVIFSQKEDYFSFERQCRFRATKFHLKIKQSIMQSTEMPCLSECLFLSRLIGRSNITKQTALGKQHKQYRLFKQRRLQWSSHMTSSYCYIWSYLQNIFMRIPTESSSQHHLLGLRDDHTSFVNKFKYQKQMVKVTTYKLAGTLAKTFVE